MIVNLERVISLIYKDFQLNETTVADLTVFKIPLEHTEFDVLLMLQFLSILINLNLTFRQGECLGNNEHLTNLLCLLTGVPYK